jgi:hypothetical protein
MSVIRKDVDTPTNPSENTGSGGARQERAKRLVALIRKQRTEVRGREKIPVGARQPHQFITEVLKSLHDNKYTQSDELRHFSLTRDTPLGTN